MLYSWEGNRRHGRNNNKNIYTIQFTEIIVVNLAKHVYAILLMVIQNYIQIILLVDGLQADCLCTGISSGHNAH